MKKIFKNLFLLAALAGVAYSCDPADTELVSGEAKMVSFGFYAEDNQGVLFEDYVVVDSTATSFLINLPKEVNPSSLVARFVTTENDSVTIAEVGQVSGITANDFSVPVDYIVTDGTNNTRYTVTVGKASAYTWSKMEAYHMDSTVGISLKINPKNGMPYILYKQDRINTADEKAAMIRLNGNNWEYVGDQAGLSLGRIDSYMDFTFDSVGTPYVVYPDYVATLSKTATVRYFNGTEWANLGNQGFTVGAVTYSAISFSPENKLMTFNMLNVAAGGLLKREMDVSYFDNNAWTTSTTITGRTPDMISYNPIAKLVNGTLYVGIYNANTTSTFSVYSYKNGIWTVIADKMLEEGATGSNLYDFDMEVDKAGNIYIAVADNGSDGVTFKPRVKKYNAQTQTWSSVGDVINVNLSLTRKFDLALSPYGVPFFIYRNVAQYPTVVSLDTETQQWTAETVLEETVADDVWMDFAPNGKAYATFTNGKGFIYTYLYSTPAAL